MCVPVYLAIELDPTRVCKGKGVVTLRATLVHIDDEDCVSEESNVDTAPSKSKRMLKLLSKILDFTAYVHMCSISNISVIM